MKKRLLLRAAMLIIVGVTSLATLISCGAPSSSSDANTLSFWVRASMEEQVQLLAKAYNASHKTQIKVNAIPDANFVQKFGASVASGSSPDIVSLDLVYMPTFTAADQMTDITDLAKKLSYFDKLMPSHIRLSTHEEKIYGLPFTVDGSFLLYNKGLFRQAGLDPEKPPTTWAEIEAYSKKITALGNGIKGFYFPGRCAGCNAFTMLPLIWASGGDVLSEDGKSATMNSQAVKDALSFYRKMWVEEQIPAGAKVDSGSNFFSSFTTGKIGMAGSGAFSITTLKKQFPKIDFGVTYLPGKDGKTSSFAGGDVIGVPKGSRHVDKAFEFIDWALSEEVQVDIFAKGGALPIRTDLAENEYTRQDARYLTAASAMAQGRTPYSAQYNQLFNDANGPWIAAIQQAVFDGKVDEAVNTAQKRFTQILSDA